MNVRYFQEEGQLTGLTHGVVRLVVARPLLLGDLVHLDLKQTVLAAVDLEHREQVLPHRLLQVIDLERCTRSKNNLWYVAPHADKEKQRRTHRLVVATIHFTLCARCPWAVKCLIEKMMSHLHAGLDI